MAKDKTKLKILLLDIETFPILVYTWSLFNKQPISHDSIYRDWSIICIGYKWLGERTKHYVAVEASSVLNDKPILKEFAQIYSEADLVIHHNGDNFDLPKINTRMLDHNLAPLLPIPSIDTLKVARQYFAFTSNRLDYLGKFLKCGKKIKTDYELWLQCLDGNEKALEKMIKYCCQDVLLLEQVYYKLEPIIRNLPAIKALYTTVLGLGCLKPSCDSKLGHWRGYWASGQTTKRRWVCKKCGGCSSFTKAQCKKMGVVWNDEN